MSVLAPLRNLSKMEFYRVALQLRDALEVWLLKDFATRNNIRDISAKTDPEIKEKIDELLDETNHGAIRRCAPRWYAEDEQRYLLGLVRDMIRHIVKANIIYIGPKVRPCDFDLRRNHQTEAITDISALTEEIFEIQNRFPSDLNHTIPLLELCEKESDLLEGWKKADAKYAPK